MQCLIHIKISQWLNSYGSLTDPVSQQNSRTINGSDAFRNIVTPYHIASNSFVPQSFLTIPSQEMKKRTARIRVMHHGHYTVMILLYM